MILLEVKVARKVPLYWVREKKEARSQENQKGHLRSTPGSGIPEAGLGVQQLSLHRVNSGEACGPTLLPFIFSVLLQCYNVFSYSRYNSFSHSHFRIFLKTDQVGSYSDSQICNFLILIHSAYFSLLQLTSHITKSMLKSPLENLAISLVKLHLQYQ